MLIQHSSHGLARDILEAPKVLDKHQTHLCVFASDCDGPVCLVGGGVLWWAPNQPNEGWWQEETMGMLGFYKTDQEGKNVKYLFAVF